MVMTPEGRVKKDLRKLLNSYGAVLYHYWPVPSGYGEQSLDVLCCHKGAFFAIEAKAPGKKPTGRQRATMKSMALSGGLVFVVDGPESLQNLKDWLDSRT